MDKGPVVPMVVAFLWGDAFSTARASALYHILRGHDLLTAELAQGYFQLGSAAVFALGFGLYLWERTRRA